MKTTFPTKAQGKANNFKFSLIVFSVPFHLLPIELNSDEELCLADPLVITVGISSNSYPTCRAMVLLPGTGWGNLLPSFLLVL